MGDPLVERLRAGGCVFAEDEAALLRAAATGRALDDLVASRVAGAPLEHLLGRVDFGGRRLTVRDGVFVPRQRTLLLAGLAVGALRPGGVLVELCCGVAPVATVAADAGAEAYACDVDAAAVACARLNLGHERVFLGDLYDALPPWLRGRVDVLAANAPYVPTADIDLMPREARLYESRTALDGGEDGMDLQRRIAAGAPHWLAPGGVLVVETSRAQAPTGIRFLRDAGFSVSVARDDDLDGTALRATFTADRQRR